MIIKKEKFIPVNAVHESNIMKNKNNFYLLEGREIANNKASLLVKCFRKIISQKKCLQLLFCFISFVLEPLEELT